MKVSVIPVTPLQQNCSVLVCEQTGRAAVVDPGADLDEIVDVIEDVEIVDVIEDVEIVDDLVEVLDFVEEIEVIDDIDVIEDIEEAEVIDDVPIVANEVRRPRRPPRLR